MMAAIHKRDVPIHAAIAVVLWLCVAAAWHQPWLPAAFYLALFYTLIHAFQLPAARRLRPPGDFSYGVYIWGFVIQQVFVSRFPSAHPLVNALVCMPVAVCLGGVSWFAVERPSLAAARALLATLDAGRAAEGGAHARRRTAAMVSCVALVLLAPQTLMLLPKADIAPASSPDLRVVNYGPIPITHGQAFNVQPDGSWAIWVRASRPVPENAELWLDNTSLVSSVSGDLITARVPARLVAEPADLALRVIEQVRGRVFASAPVTLAVR
jgi:hypothetical protein